MRPPKIEFIASTEDEHGLPEPVPAAKVVPDWYKRLPRSRNPDTGEPSSNLVWADPEKGFTAGATIKECIPVRDYITAGYVIPLWASLVIHTTDEGGNYFSWQNEDCLRIENHGDYQTAGTPFAREGEHSMKLISPWLFKTPPGYSCLFFSPRYNQPNIEIMPAIVDTDVQFEVNFPFWFHPRKDARDYIIERGTPVVQVMPFKRTDWGMKTTYSDASKRNGLNKFIRSFALGGYRKLRHHKKTFR